MLISVHIPKTAGTTFRNQLQQRFGDRLQLDYGDRPLARGYRARRFAQRWAQRAASIDAMAFDCVHGHFVADKYDYLGASARWITWLRDPVQRVASHYRYWQRVPDLRNEDCRRLIEQRLSLEEFAALPRMRNVATRFFGGRRPEDFFFIGLVEQLEESQRRLQQLLAIAPDAGAAENRNEERADAGYDLPDAVWARVDALNSKDRDLYTRACALFRGDRGT